MQYQLHEEAVDEEGVCDYTSNETLHDQIEDWRRGLEESFSSYLPRVLVCVDKHERFIGLTAQPPAIPATIPPEITIGRTPLVLLKSIPLSAPATMLFAESCFPL